MTHELVERTVRDWVLGNPERGARDLRRLAGESLIARDPNEIANALIELAGRLHVANTRIW